MIVGWVETRFIASKVILDIKLDLRRDKSRLYHTHLICIFASKPFSKILVLGV
jgi:hypothetical protein